MRPNSVSRRLTASRALPHSSSTSCPSASVRLAFDDVSFQVGYGEVFGFLGPNGTGKTTTVRTLGTLISPTSGRRNGRRDPAESGEWSGDLQAHLDHAGVPRPLPPPHSGREPRVLRRPLRAPERA